MGNARKIVLLALLFALNGCKSAEKANDSELESSRRPPTGGLTEKKCGRDGRSPFCSEVAICAQPVDSENEGVCREDIFAKSRPKQTTMLKSLKSKVNAANTTIKINADVYAANNSCKAKAAKVSFEVTTEKVMEETVHHVWPVSKIGIVACPATVPMAVYKPATITLDKIAIGKDRVVVHEITDGKFQNVDRRVDHELVFGSNCLIPQCAAPPQGCHYRDVKPKMLDEMGCSIFKCGMMVCDKDIDSGLGQVGDSCGSRGMSLCASGLTCLGAGINDVPGRCVEAVACKAGETLVDIGNSPKDGCSRKPVCVGRDTCPMQSLRPPGWCKDGKIVPLGYNERGCFRGAACVKDPTSCPQLSPPAPNWCQGGKVVDGGVNDDGCQRAPFCITADSCKNNAD